MTRLGSTTARRLSAALIGTALLLAACGGSDDSSESSGTDAEARGCCDHRGSGTTDAPEATDAPATTEAASDGVRRVPADYPTIQEAVDAADPGDLVLISPGIYNEAVNVATDELTIRGLDRNEVILDGEFELENGIRVLGASGVAVENMTAINYTVNGFYWIEADGYRGVVPDGAAQQ